MTNEELARLEGLAKAATQGAWFASEGWGASHYDGCGHILHDESSPRETRYCGLPRDHEDHE